MSLLALIMWAVITGNTVMQYGNQPLDMIEVEQVSTQIEKPFLEGRATWYDYKLNWKRWSKNHSTCALRIKERYKTYKVCIKGTEKCIECFHNDRGPSRQDRVIDLSSYAFKKLWVPLSRWVVEVLVYEVK